MNPTLKQLAAQLRKYHEKHPEAGECEVEVDTKDHVAGHLTLRDGSGNAPSGWHDVELPVVQADQSRQVDLGPYHPNRSFPFAPLPRARCRFFTYSLDRVAELDANRFEQLFYGHRLEAPLVADGDLPVATVVTTAQVSVYFARFRVKVGVIPNRSLAAVGLASRMERARKIVNERNESAERHEPYRDERFQYAQWPRDWKDQVGQALSVSVESIVERGLGGPLLCAMNDGVRLAVGLHLMRACDRDEAATRKSKPDVRSA